MLPAYFTMPRRCRHAYDLRYYADAAVTRAGAIDIPRAYAASAHASACAFTRMPPD